MMATNWMCVPQQWRVAMELKESDLRAPWPTTHWSLVGRTGAAGLEERRQAISSVLSIYSPVLRGHLISRWRIKQDRVNDVLHDFLLSKVLVDSILGLADQDRGRFRTFLARSLDNFVRNYFRDQSRKKRGGDRIESLDTVLDPMDHASSPRDAFDYAWARQVLGQAVKRMRTHCRITNRRDIWGIFRSRILRPTLSNLEPVAYAELVREFRLKSPRQAINLLKTGIRMFARSIRGVLFLYEKDERELDSEIRDLWRAVSRPQATTRKISKHPR
jgi:DNA-directed RNA polymerase specialized sigma24 family protein